MAVNPMLASGINGIQQSMRGFEQAGREVTDLYQAQPDGEGKRLEGAPEAVEAIVDLKIYQRQVQASAKVVQMADEVMGFLLGTTR